MDQVARMKSDSQISITVYPFDSRYDLRSNGSLVEFSHRAFGSFIVELAIKYFWISVPVISIEFIYRVRGWIKSIHELTFNVLFTFDVLVVQAI